MKSTASFAVYKLTWLLCLVLLGGCASTVKRPPAASESEFASVHALLDQHRVTDARYEFLENRDFYAVDLPLQFRMRAYIDQSGVKAKRRFIEEVLVESNALAIEALKLELARLPAAVLRDHRRDFYPAFASTQALIDAYIRSAKQTLHQDRSLLAGHVHEAALDGYWARFNEEVRTSILDRGRWQRMLLTAPAVPVIKGWIAYHEVIDDRDPQAVDFAQSELYTPAAAADQSFIPEHDWWLLQHFAPQIVHEVNPVTDYSIDDDRFGRVELTGASLEEAMPVVDTARPTVYAYVEHKRLQGVSVRQLVYTLWHPEHPKLGRFDPEAGILDGWTVRITLDAKNRPIDYESISNCGCYYKNFPTGRLEALARQAFPKRLEDKRFYLENDVSGEYDAVVPELVADTKANRAHDTWLYFSAGHHQLVTIRSTAHQADAGRITANRGYELRPYAELEQMSFNGIQASLFDPEGLVRKAHRPECSMLTPSGLYHAGHARQRGTQMIYFDDAAFDDPALLETYLRLPPGAMGG